MVQCAGGVVEGPAVLEVRDMGISFFCGKDVRDGELAGHEEAVLRPMGFQEVV